MHSSDTTNNSGPAGALYARMSLRFQGSFLDVLMIKMAQQTMKAKLNYKPTSSIEVFYSGGAVSVSKEGHLACACQDDIKVALSYHELTCSALLCTVYVDSVLTSGRGQPVWGCHQNAVRGKHSKLASALPLALFGCCCKPCSRCSQAVFHLQDSEAVTALAFSPDGRHLFSASRSLQLKWWDPEQGTCLRSWKVCP